MASPEYSIPMVDNRWRHFLQRDDSALLLERPFFPASHRRLQAIWCSPTCITRAYEYARALDAGKHVPAQKASGRALALPRRRLAEHFRFLLATT